MIIEKTYKINTLDVDSAILEIAEDIKKGYTIYTFKHELSECGCSTQTWRPNILITLRNTKAYLEDMRGIF